MRLVEGYRGEGLRGISQEADIPYCTGIYGASQSGGRDYALTGEGTLMVARNAGDGQENLPPTREYRKEGFEHGGVRIYRPLMDYSKDQLEATLEKAGVPWVTDPTNRDPTISIRNAIRYLMQRRLLPKALASGSHHEPSALRIAANKIRHKYQRRNEEADSLFQACEIISFDARSGCLIVRLPLFPIPKEPYFQIDRQRTHVEHVGARLVRRLLSIVSPRDDISLQSLEFATRTIFGDSRMTIYSDGTTRPRQSKFTAGVVLCEQIEMPIKKDPLPTAQPFTLDPKYTWCLSREKYSRDLAEPVCVVPHTTQIQQPEEVAQIDGTSVFEPVWQLWDGRYWIQLVNPTDKPLKVCPLSEDRLLRLRKRLCDNVDTKYLGRKLMETLKSIGPPHVRHTLPAIIGEEDIVLEIPTIGFKTPAVGPEDAEMGCVPLQWRIRYKQVVFPDHVKDERIVALRDEEMQGVRD